MNNKIVKLTLILFLVCAVTAGVLGGVNALTAPKIAERAAAKTAEAYKAVMDAPGFTEVSSDKYAGAHPTVKKVDEATDGSGWVVTSTFSGAQGSITMLVGVNSDYTCSGISITEHSETSGLGANAASTGQVGIDFRAQFVGKDSSLTLGDIDALTGATITSKAVTGAVVESINTCKDLG